MGQNPGNILFIQPGEYFQGAVAGAVATLKIKVSERSQIYLAQLLGQFINVENLYPLNAEGQKAETLTEQLAVALEQETHEQRLTRLRKLGDFSLYIAGFFSDSFQRKLIDVDYYIGMGGAAYESVARMEEKRVKSELFMELAQRFPDFVEVLGQISEESGFNLSNNKDLLRMYDLYLKTGSDRKAKQLAKAGIVAPISLPKKKDGSEN